MKWIKQSFNFLKNHPRETLVLSIFSLLVLYISSFVPFFGVVIASFGFVFLQAGIFQALSSVPLREAKPIPLDTLWVKPSRALFLTAFILIPTNIMMGSVSGLAQGSDSLFLALFMIVTFSIMCALTFIVIAHTIGFIVLRKLRFGLALEKALHGITKFRFSLLMLSCLSAAALLVSVLPLGILTGVGLIISLPLHFCVYYFSFQDLYPVTDTSESTQLLTK